MGFLIHFLAVLYGGRLQFHDWWLDLRVPAKSTHSLHISESVANDCVAKCFETWKSWDAPTRKRMINVMIMFARAVCYEWKNAEYMVFDGCFKIADDLHGLTKTNGGRPHTRSTSCHVRTFRPEDEKADLGQDCRPTEQPSSRMPLGSRSTGNGTFAHGIHAAATRASP